ncbi:serine/threonine-protein kinase [Roseateles sp.]|uniref:serine/threonine-protein kinase n=1 Tax=Roseateles sp. TaxID=1971397 RepID=UPI003266D21E
MSDAVTPLSTFEADWPAISALLDEALKLPTAEHTTWLDSLAGEHALYRDSLRLLLKHRHGIETDDFLGQLPRLNIEVMEPPADGLGPGGQVGTYRLISEIGRGGMGTVWLAERSDGLMKRRVALKLPRVVWGDAFAERLGREREILATLEHQHIARLYDAGVDAQGRPFLAMEYVEGRSIDAYCREHSASVRERIELLLQVMAAVSHAHARLVVHRDLKPGNILVTPDGQVKLLDFGIAKLLEGDRTRETALTELGGRALTLDYASPEQIRGEPLGTASDVYSMAVVAYELLAGARPYRLKRGTPAEIEEAIATDEPRLASDAATTPDARKALRGDLDAILNRGLKKSTAQRYASMESFAQDLQRYLRGEPVLARPDSWRYRASKFVRRHGTAVVMTSALASAIVVGAAISLWQARIAREEQRLGRAELDGASAVRELYVETMMQLSVATEEAPDSLARPHAVTLALRQKLDAMAPRLKDRPIERAAQLFAVVLQLDHTEEFESVVPVARQLIESLKAQNAAPYKVIEAHRMLGAALFRLRRWDECEAVRRAGVEWAPDTRDPNTEAARATVATGLGSILRIQGKRAEAEAVFMRNEETLARSLPHEPVRFENLKQLSQFLLGWDDARALKYAQLAQAGVAKAAELGQIERAPALRSLGYALQANGRAPEAEAAASAALQGFTTSFGLANRNTLRAKAAVADAISRQGDYARSDAFLAEQEHQMAGTAGGVTASMVRLIREQRLESAWLSGDSESVAEVFSRDANALLAPAALGDNDLTTFWPLLALDLAGRPREALEAMLNYRKSLAQPVRATLIWIRTLEIQAKLELAAAEPAAALGTARALMAILSTEHAATGRAYRVAAEFAALAAARLGNRAEAERALASAETAKLALFPTPVERAESSLRRAEVLSALGHRAEAVSAARAALADLTGQHPRSPRLAQARQLADL